MIKKSNLQSIDFEALYRQQKQKTDFKPKEKADWDKRAPQMRTQLMASIYNDAFLEAIDLEGCESLLDVGCGPGNLCLRLAPKLKSAHALDFSPLMLEALSQNAAELGVGNVATHELSWEDDWHTLPRCDLVIASRSMEVADMGDALRKLNTHAGKRVYITYKQGGSFIEPEILTAIDREIEPKPDYIYIVNILYNMGINATVRFLPSEGKGLGYQDEEAFVKSVSWSLGELSGEEEKRLRAYYQKRAAINDLSDRPVYWALIGWEKA